MASLLPIYGNSVYRWRMSEVVIGRGLCPLCAPVENVRGRHWLRSLSTCQQ